jgi:hypothetical protein
MSVTLLQARKAADETCREVRFMRRDAPDGSSALDATRLPSFDHQGVDFPGSLFG